MQPAMTMPFFTKKRLIVRDAQGLLGASRWILDGWIC